MPVRQLEELEFAPHLKAVDMIQIADHPTEGKYLLVRNPVSFCGGHLPVFNHAPHLGQDSLQILAEAGFSEKEINELLRLGIVGR